MPLKLKLLVPAIIGFLLIGVLVRMYWIPDYIEAERQQFSNTQMEILRSLDPSLTKYIVSRDLAALHSSMEHLMEINKQRWLSLKVTSADGRHLYPLTEPDANFPASAIRLTHDIDDYGDSIGTVSVVANWNAYIQGKEAAIRNAEWLALCIFGVILGLGVLWQGAWITAPLARLKSAAEKLAKGDFSTRLPAAADDDIGALTTTFAFMQNELRRTHDQLQEALEQATVREVRQRAILNAVEDGIITTNSRGLILSVNSGAKKIFGETGSHFLNRHFSALFLAADGDPDSPGGLAPELYTGRTIAMHARRKDGSTLDIEFTMVEMLIRDEKNYMGVIRDITAQKEADRIKDAFVSTVSHELRTPLTAIKGSLGLLQHMSPQDTLGNIDNLLDVANRNVDRLSRLINDLLDIARLEEDYIEFDYENIPISEFIEEATRLNQAYAGQFHSHITTSNPEPDAMVLADRERLMQAVSNVLSNAIKLSPEGSEIKLAASVDEKCVRIAVTDNGPGVPDEFGDKMFEKFTQYESGNTRKVGSSGLGLHITKKIVEGLQGQVEFRNNPTGGATFFIALPLSQPR